MLGTVGNKQDADLISSNIKDGVEIFGVDGNYKGDISSIGSINNINTQIISMVSGGNDFDTSIERRLFMQELTNHFIVVLSIDSKFSSSGGDERPTAGIYIVEKTTSKISVFSDIRQSYTYYTQIEIDDTNGYIKIGDGTNFLYYNISTNTLSATDPGGTYTSYSWNTIPAWNNNTLPTFVSKDTEIYNTKTYDVQFFEHEMGGSESIIMTRMVIS